MRKISIYVRWSTFGEKAAMESALMEEAREHLSYVILDDATKRRTLETQHWQHLQECYECTLRLASMLAVEADYEELRKKFPAA